MGQRPTCCFGWKTRKMPKVRLSEIYPQNMWLTKTIEIIQTQNWQSSFTIPSPPPAADNDRLIQDMILQAESLPKETDPKGTTYIATTVIDHILSELKQPTIYNEYLTILHADKKDQFSSRKLAIAIENLRAAAANREGMFSVTVVLMPPSSSHSKRTAQPYGTYDLPSKLGPRREASEAPLSPVSSKPSTSPNVPDLEDSPVITQAEQNNTTPVLGILKQCYSSESECTQTTNSCSGHGKCALFREGEKGSGGRTDCYACVCVPSVSKVGDTGMETHIKTTYWGGPACQKKDVSVPFWLFVGSGVLLAFLISTGIGMLYSMGNEELPSVIGAGVSGPTRK